MSSGPSSFPLRPGVASRANTPHKGISMPSAGTPQTKDPKKRVKTTEVFSQPKDTGTGTQKGTQLSYLISALKEKKGPIRLEELGAHAGVPDAEHDPVLVKALNEHERVAFDTKMKLYSWRPDFQVKDKQTVLAEITRNARGGAGVSIKQLRESWAGSPQAVEELEKEGLVLVTRSARDDHMKMVFRNDLTPEQGGKKVDEEFCKLWHSLVVPTEAEMLKSLESEGLQITTAESSAKTGNGQKKKGKKTSNRQRPIKFTNTHLRDVDISKDYVVPPKEDA
ncbi:transcription initiation factor IIE subunit beta [Ceratobasidium sp. AG-Ba]|nr:transcription initiation factor IIE subunit beta [Ceratobasidium sp. AG-Ba]QRW10653.1 transcription initiation factor IIE subunit beta [Ceratobasidium sp. AG-Ba]